MGVSLGVVWGGGWVWGGGGGGGELPELQRFGIVCKSRCTCNCLTAFYSGLPSFLRLHEYSLERLQGSKA